MKKLIIKNLGFEKLLFIIRNIIKNFFKILYFYFYYM